MQVLDKAFERQVGLRTGELEIPQFQPAVGGFKSDGPGITKDESWSTYPCSGMQESCGANLKIVDMDDAPHVLRFQQKTIKRHVAANRAIQRQRLKSAGIEQRVERLKSDTIHLQLSFDRAAGSQLNLGVTFDVRIAQISRETRIQQAAFGGCV